MRARLLAVAWCAVVACKTDETGPDEAVSLEFSALPSPSVVLGDTLRDTSGIASPARAKAFNTANEELAAAQIVYTILDRGARVDSLSGIVIGDSLRDTPVRVIASVGSLQSAPVSLFIVVRPDSAVAGAATDTVRYSVSDTTKNVSAGMIVQVLHKPGTGTTPVRAYPVSFRITYPANPLAAALLGDDGRPSFADTTAADGTASIKVRIRPEHLVAARDSVVVLASVRYRGAHVRGSPVRLVLPFRPLVQ